jgi:hypothetical protein
VARLRPVVHEYDGRPVTVTPETDIEQMTRLGLAAATLLPYARQMSRAQNGQHGEYPGCITGYDDENPQEWSEPMPPSPADHFRSELHRSRAEATYPEARDDRAERSAPVQTFGPPNIERHGLAAVLSTGVTGYCRGDAVWHRRIWVTSTTLTRAPHAKTAGPFARRASARYLRQSPLL